MTDVCRGRARIVRQKKVARGYWDIRLDYVDASRPLKLPEAGRFFTILPSNPTMRVMRRPFAYSDADMAGFSFIYETRGPG